MKNIDEIKAEVFRRSKEKVKKRKKIRNVVIPLCVFTLTISVILASQFNIFDADKNAFDGSLMPESSSFVGYSSLVIEVDEKVRIEKDNANIENIYNILASSFKEVDDSLSDEEAKPPKKQGTIKGEGENYSYLTGDSIHIDNSKKEYILNFKSEKGEDKVYILKGNVLTDKSSKQEVKLTNAELIELQKLLNLQIILEEK